MSSFVETLLTDEFLVFSAEKDERHFLVDRTCQAR